VTETTGAASASLAVVALALLARLRRRRHRLVLSPSIVAAASETGFPRKIR
jgi:MYXO-CTERM domain-containing protein